MTDPISAATGIVSLARTLGELLAKIKDKSVRDELQDSIFRIREEALRLQEENATLRDENRKLRDLASERVNAADYERRGNAIWRKDGDGPYCLRCFQEEKKARTLVRVGPHSTAGKCLVCNTEVYEVYEAKPFNPIILGGRPRNRLEGIEDL